ncbi:MAG: GAF domain-containing protein [Chitinivibrionales bacterium]|nr:GAF domain-containing protein [Chitinivibrionales bacterium]MBD3396718.1 GAF domain-containing protein [Chitinivibrionales bacterium]
MPMRIAILGTAPPADISTIETCARRTCADSGSHVVLTHPAPGTPFEEVPSAFVSYVPCTPESMREVFAYLPVGSGESIPFFQKIDRDEAPEFLAGLPVFGVFRSPLSPAFAQTMCSSIASHDRYTGQNRTLMGEVVKYRKQKHQLVKIGAALSSQNDLGELLNMILAESRDLVDADAGSIYVRERSGPGKRFVNRLRFMIAQNDSVEIAAKSREFSLDIDQNSIAGYVAFTGETLNIDDVNELDASVPYKFGKSFERKFGYRVKSMLTVPLKNLAGQVVGVVQLMNKKRDPQTVLSGPDMVADAVISFSYSDEDFVRTIASLAAVSVERVQLYDDIRQLFEGFLDSSIAAVDERDRVTSGHSRRVMGYALSFADAINSAGDGPFADEHFSDARRRQFKFAALLHDIGKIGVPESLLNKETRVSAGEFAGISSRFELVRFQVSAGRENLAWHSIEELNADWEFLDKVNRSGFLSEEDQARLSSIRDKTYADASGHPHPILTDLEWEALSVRKGNLTLEERDLINSHAVSTWRILSKIPWTSELENIPDIAAHHHEKLDGSGYPDGLLGDEISLESKILAVVDIYEALVAQDRPYKPAMPPERALAILDAEVKQGHLDPDIVRFFAEKGIHRIFIDPA